ncbi:hypothetical protein B296_00002212 [Ensete ventricosum]|uniref:Methyltransferase n=1 Tax=Ensete ventricosum TaxID=4639 RepID=A0A427B4R6_ENSVE|nr:hypothetical protein B296_00002212 [Ensete ventricosum]
MAFGRSSRTDTRRTSSSYCSTTTLVIFVALCLVGAWMMTSSTMAPAEVPSPATKSDMSDMVSRTSSDPYKDGSDVMSEDSVSDDNGSGENNMPNKSDSESDKTSEKLEEKTEEENPTKGSDDTNNDSDDSRNTQNDGDANGNKGGETIEEAGDAKEGNDTGDEAGGQEQKSKPEQDEKSDVDKTDNGKTESIIEEKVDQSSDEDKDGNQLRDKSNNEIFPSGAQTELLNETSTQNGAWSTQAVESKNEKEVQASSSSKGQTIEYSWKLCNVKAGADYIPCLDNEAAIKKLPSTKHYEHRERHCPDNAPTCLVPLPDGYKRPIKWPKSREKVLALPVFAFDSSYCKA